MLSFLPEGFVTNCNNISKCLQRNEYEVRQNLVFGSLALAAAAAAAAAAATAAAAAAVVVVVVVV